MQPDPRPLNSHKPPKASFGSEGRHAQGRTAPGRDFGGPTNPCYFPPLSPVALWFPSPVPILPTADVLREKSDRSGGARSATRREMLSRERSACSHGEAGERRPDIQGQGAAPRETSRVGAAPAPRVRFQTLGLNLPCLNSAWGVRPGKAPWFGIPK